MKVRVAKNEKVRPSIMRVGRSPIVAHADEFKARHYLANCFHLDVRSRGEMVWMKFEAVRL